MTWLDADVGGRGRRRQRAVCSQVGRPLPRWRGSSGLLDRSSAPHLDPASHERSSVCEAIVALCGGCGSPAAEIAETLGMALVDRLRDPDAGSGWASSAAWASSQLQRYERERPGELIHVDVKKLGRIQGGAGKRVTRQAATALQPGASADRCRRTTASTVGWECVHIAIDDCTRLAYAEVLPDEKASSAVAFLRRTRAFYPSPRDRDRAAPSPITAALISRSLTPSTSRTLGIQPPLHPSLPPSNKREGRALHPHRARWLGLRRDLPQQPRAHRGP